MKAFRSFSKKALVCPVCFAPIVENDFVVYGFYRNKKFLIHPTCEINPVSQLARMRLPTYSITAEQETFTADYLHGAGHTTVYAGPGTGKTSTAAYAVLKGLLTKQCVDDKVGFFAFNTDIVAALETKISAIFCDLNTFHRFGRSLIADAWKIDSRIKPENKLYHIFTTQMQGDQTYRSQQQDVLKRFHIMERVVNAAMNSCVTHEQLPHQIDQLAMRFEIALPKKDTNLARDCQRLYRLSLEDKTHVNFDEMLYFLKHYQIELPRYDKIVVDEEQDMNDLQHWLILSLAALGARVIGIGDPNQAIYGWRGARTDSMQVLQRSLQSKTLTLMTCFRIKNLAILREAQKIVPGLQPGPDAVEGKPVSVVMSREMLQSVRPGDAILSRVNAPLIEICLDLLAQSVMATILGREIGEGIVDMIQLFAEQSDDVEVVYRKGEQWLTYEAARTHHNQIHMAKCEDELACIRAIGSRCKTVTQMIAKALLLFADNGLAGKVVLASCHKSKGLEFKRVWLITGLLKDRGNVCEMFPHPRVVREDLVEQEINLKFVGITRAQEELQFVEY